MSIDERAPSPAVLVPAVHAPELLAAGSELVETHDVEPEAPEPPHVSILTSDHPEIGDQVRFASQQLYTDVYLKRGFIEQSDLNPVGNYTDGYFDQSKYYYSKNGQKVATARQIFPTKKGGLMSLPTAKEFGVDADALAEAAGVSSVAEIKHTEVVEISALASKRTEGDGGDFDAVISLYSRMIRDSMEAGHKLWLLNTDARFVDHLKLLVGEEQVHKLGEPRAYMGPPTTPVAINPQAVVREILSSEDPGHDYHKQHIRELFKNIDAKKIPQDIQELFTQNEIEFEPVGKFRQHLTKEEIAVQGLMLAFSSARAFPAGGLNEFQGDVATLWGIDVATSVPYTHGMMKMLYSGKNFQEKAVGASIAIPSFLAPYAYLYATEGQNGYPGYVNAAVGGFVTLAVGKEIIARKLRGRKERRLRVELENIPEASH